MRRISPNNPVRRRLFSADHTDEASTDNFVNVFQESISSELEDKKKKWNFDFKNDIPLEGEIKWSNNGPDLWIGVIAGDTETTDTTDVDDCEPNDPLLEMKNENEVTPKSNKEESVPLIRKRKNDVEKMNASGVKRKISFD